MYKNQLQELAQRSCFNLPSYACIREGPDHAPRFKATVNFNGETFESPSFCSTLRQAEHSAAEVALAELSKRGPSRSLAARVLLMLIFQDLEDILQDETGVYKNLLQETAHRAGLNLPVYTTVRSGPGHVPVFHCTVELAGLSFTGEPAKTKKQAQKNAAMAAWSVLKQLPRMQSSKIEVERKDEQEQIVVARALAKLCPSDMQRSTLHIERHHERQRSSPMHRDMSPASSGIHLYPMQYPSWHYPHNSPEMTMFRMWHPEQTFQQQNCLITLPMAPSQPGPPILPLVHPVFQPGHGQYILARDKEPVSVIPGLPMSAPSQLFSNHAMHPINVRTRSQVTIQEIQEERPQEEEKWLPGDSNSDGHKIEIQPKPSMFPQLEAQNRIVSNKTPAEPTILEKSSEGQKHGRSELDSGHSAKMERNQSDLFSWSSPDPIETENRSQDTVHGHVETRLGSMRGFDSSQSKLAYQHPPKPCSGGVSKYFTQPSNAAPVRIRTVGSASSGNARPESLKPWVPTQATFRAEAPGCSSRHRPMYTGRMASPNFMAPAVQIRSVIPVCSAPPVKGPESSVEEGDHSVGERTKEPKDVEAANFELGKLRI